MAESLKILGQANPSAASLTALYTVPALTMATVSTLAICNRTAGKVEIRVSVAVNGAADALQQYLYYDSIVTANDSIFATLGITLGAGDVVRVYTDTLGVSFNLFGVEVT